MSNYYDYREVGVMIAHRLMAMEGWKVYGYKADESDGMTDYYSPAHWGGVAEKNGYVLCVNVYGSAERQEIKKYKKNSLTISADTQAKINKLQTITVERGATVHEEETAREKIKALQNKQEECQNDYEIIGYIPGHQAHPSRCNWHIEKDDVIVAKGNGILKYSSVYDYFTYDNYKKDLDLFKKSPETWLNDWVEDVTIRGYYTTIEEAKKAGQSRMEEMQSKWEMIDSFNKFIKKIDTTCGGMIGEGEIVQYEKITVTEYKKENKVVECSGSLKEGQCFILKTEFNYGRYKGLVYRIHENEYNGKKYYTAYKLNGKLTKECTGRASRNNSWTTFGEKFDKWIANGAIAFCEIKEVKTPYEVEKLVKKTIKAEAKNETAKPQEQAETNDAIIKSEYSYVVTQDTDTRDNSIIYLVKVEEKLNRNEYLEVAKMIKSLGGYYSRFKHAFIFKDDPSNKLGLNNENKATVEESPAHETTEPMTETEINESITLESSEQEEEQQPEPQENISITFNKSMNTIEIRLENAKQETINLLKQNNYTWLSFVGAYVKDDNYSNRRFIQDNFSEWVESVA